MSSNRVLPVRKAINRRAFLRGAGGAVAIGLPFLEGLPSRSAWAQDAPPTFGFFMCSANGVVPQQFWPSEMGALSASTMDGKAVGKLVDYASNLLIIGDVKYPGAMTNCGHAQGLVQALTGKGPQGGGPSAQASGISADMVISAAVNPQGVDPLTLYSGKKSYIGERLSFAGAGNARAAQLNPYATYQTLVGMDQVAPETPVTPGTGEPSTPTLTDELLIRRQSVNDLVREDLASLVARTDLSSADRARLEQHMEAVRQIEVNMDTMGVPMMEAAAVQGCSSTGVNTSGIEAFKDGINFSQNGNMIEDIVKLHSEVVAFAFACNANRVASLQWGDGTDATKYEGISGPGWPFHQISHRVQSDGALGNDASAEQAHAEIDVIRMETLAHCLKHFKDRGLLEMGFVYWTSHVATGAHTFNNLPIIIAGNAGGFLKQGEYMSGDGATNDKVLGTLITAAGASGEAELAGMLA